MTRIDWHRLAGTCLVAVASLGLALWAGPAAAGSNEWSGAGADDNWTTPGNWAGGVIPTNNGATSIRFRETDNGNPNVLDCNNLGSPSNIWHVGFFRDHQHG